MASEFLNNLKKSVEEGDFNSEAAKKITEINKLADVVESTGNAGDSVSKRLEESGHAQAVPEDVALELNTDYEEQLALIKKQDMINQQLATLVDIEDMVKLSIVDMLEFVTELDKKFEKEFEFEYPMFGDLYLKIEEIKLKFNSIINK